jgi:hypothetical protein
MIRIITICSTLFVLSILCASVDASITAIVGPGDPGIIVGLDTADYPWIATGGGFDLLALIILPPPGSTHKVTFMPDGNIGAPGQGPLEGGIIPDLFINGGDGFYPWATIYENQPTDSKATISGPLFSSSNDGFFLTVMFNDSDVLYDGLTVDFVFFNGNTLVDSGAAVYHLSDNTWTDPALTYNPWAPSNLDLSAPLTRDMVLGIPEPLSILVWGIIGTVAVGYSLVRRRIAS